MLPDQFIRYQVQKLCQKRSILVLIKFKITSKKQAINGAFLFIDDSRISLIDGLELSTMRSAASTAGFLEINLAF